MNRNFPPRCYYCSFNPFANADNYERHIVTKHPLLPGYPNIGDLQKYKLLPQDMPWEKPLSDAETLERIRLYIPHDEKVKHRHRPGTKMFVE